ncbi:MAG: cyclic nucleotide-binding domain-containing protein [Chloroflexota bacterium]
MMTDKLVKYLQRQNLFKNTPVATLNKIANNLVVRTLAKDDILIRKDDPSDSLFIIRKGWVKIIAEGPEGDEMMLNQCGPGQLIGEMSLINQTPRSNTIIVLSPAEILELKYSVVLEVFN